MNNDPIQEFILKNEDNLRIAVAVSDAWSEAGEKLVKDFHDRIRSRLEKKLKGWEFDHWGCYLNDSDAGFDFWKPAWKAEYYVSLEIQMNGKYVAFGVGRDADKTQIRQRAHCTELVTAVRRRFPSAGSKKWWEAVVDMKSPAADWSTPETLWRMHDDNDFLRQVVEQLLEVAEISEPILNRFVGQLARKK